METRVVAYDIRDPKRLRRVVKTCLDSDVVDNCRSFYVASPLLTWCV